MKLRALLTEYQNTKILKGSRFLYAIFFWKTKAFSFLQQRSQLLNSIIHHVVRLLPQPQFVIQNNSGIFMVQPFDDSTTICSDYFEKQLRGWLSLPADKDVFVDIGANRGIYTIIAPTLYGYQSVHALEPNPEVFEVLKKNVALNNLQSKVTCYQLAAGETISTLPFTVDPMHKGGGHITTEKSEAVISVDVLPLDTILLSIPGMRISFIKIDTEGFEFAVLAGMKNILSDMKVGSCLMIESTQRNDLENQLRSFGFRLIEQNAYDHLF